MVALIPAAGRGTRMESVTAGRPKELLPLGGLTVIERIIAEAAEVADHVVVISSPHKPELDDVARRAGAEVIHQIEPRGLAHAVACLNAETDVLVLLGDCVYFPESPLARMDRLIHLGVSGCIALEEVPASRAHLYGIVEVDDMGTIDGIVEKPLLDPSDIEPRYAVAARYALSGGLMAYLLGAVERSTQAGEITLTSVLNAAIAGGFVLKGVALQPNQVRIDAGEPESYLAATRMDWR